MNDKCRICYSPLSPFMSFGPQPIANAFVEPSQVKNEYFYELKPAFCQECGTFQIMEQPSPELMFHDQYAFFTRTSRRMVQHFNEYANWVKTHYLTETDPFVVEIGCNDGAMLENFSKSTIRHLGIEPSANTAAEASKYGVDTINTFFNEATANQVVNKYGQADVVLAANVICHIPDLHSIAESLNILLKDNGVFIFEEPYLGNMIENTSYDQLYDEHVYIFSLKSVSSWFESFNMEIIDALPQDTHGGSMRYVIARSGTRSISSRIFELSRRESELKLDNINTFLEFSVACERSRHDLVTLVRGLRNKGKRIVGYGATSKSTTVLNYCGLGPDDIEFISDTTPIKQGKLTPGSHIPVRPYPEFQANYPDYTVLFAWNHKEEIFRKEGIYRSAGGKWITFIPSVSVISGSE